MLLILCTGVVLFATAVYHDFFGHLYTEEEILNFRNENASLVLSEEGAVLGKFFAENRTNIRFEDIPDHLVDALVATEDARFFEHEGIDSQSLLRVLFKSLLLGDDRSGGGSTITQQLAKNMYGRDDHGLLTLPVNKTKEALLARRIERLFDKEEILTLYLNTIPFGENVFGIEAASGRFFNKKTHDLKIDEAAVLIGMLKANTAYNPRLYPENAKRRRNVVLRQMEKYGYLDAEQAEALRAGPVDLDYANLESEGIANYFMIRVRKEAEAIINEINRQSEEEWDLNKDGLIIRTTLNQKLQNQAIATFNRHLSGMQEKLRKQYRTGSSRRELKKLTDEFLKDPNLQRRKDVHASRELFDWGKVRVDSMSVVDSIAFELTQLHAGMLAMDPDNGAIRVWVGGVNFRKYPYDQVLSRRQVASTFKPILYAAALDQAIEPCTYLDNDEIVLTDYNNWSPTNYDGQTGGKYSMQGALVRSMNIPTVNLYFEVGHDNLDYLWEKMDFESDLENTPAVALGTSNASIYELARAYSAFANGGYKPEPFTISSIETADGEVLYQKESGEKREKVLEEQSSLLISEMLKNATQRGTGRAMYSTYGIRHEIAGKTGTSQNFADAWYAAYTPGLVWVARVGASRPSVHFNSGSNGSGSRLALPLVAGVLQEAQNDPKLRKMVFKPFPVDDTLLVSLDCEDYIEEGWVDSVIDKVEGSKTTADRKNRKAERKRKRREKKKEKDGFFRWIFRKK